MEKDKKKVLMFLTRVPYPPVDGTRFKIFNNVIQGLKPAFDLEFCIVTDDRVKDEQIKYLEDNFGPVHLFTFPKWRFYWNAPKMFCSPLPLQAGYYYFRTVRHWLLGHIGDYDAVYVHTLRLGRYAEQFDTATKRKVLIDFNDAISLNYEEGKKFASPFWRFVYSIEEKRIRRYESRLLGGFHYFNVASRRDKEYLWRNYAATGAGGSVRPVVFENIRHGIDSKIIRYEWGGSKESLVFMGNLKYPPNADAVRHFLEHVWPTLKERMPGLAFTVIGRKDGLNFDAPQGVTFTGFVDDPYKLIAESGVFVAPLRFGAGTPTKILEAMAVGIPVITTPLGARGIDGILDGKHLLVVGTDNGEEWTRAIRRVIEDRDAARRLGASGKKFATENYLDVSSQEQFRQLFHKITGKRTG